MLRSRFSNSAMRMSASAIRSPALAISPSRTVKRGMVEVSSRAAAAERAAARFSRLP